MGRQKDRETEAQRKRENDRFRERERDSETNRQMGRYTDGQKKYKGKERQSYTETEVQRKNRMMEGQRERE